MAVEAEPISEAAYRHVMRLHYLLGDRPAALRAYARLKVMLEREVGVEPLHETGDLAQRIECGALQVPATARLREIPIGLLLKAAEIATADYRLADANELYTRTADLLHKLGREEERERVLSAKTELSAKA